MDWLEIHYVPVEHIKYDIRACTPVSPTYTPVTCQLYGSHIVGVALVNRHLMQQSTNRESIKWQLTNQQQTMQVSILPSFCATVCYTDV